MPTYISSLATTVIAHVTTYWHDHDSVHTPLLLFARLNMRQSADLCMANAGCQNESATQFCFSRRQHCKESIWCVT